MMEEKKNRCKKIVDVCVSLKLVLYNVEKDAFLVVKKHAGQKQWGFIGGTIEGKESLKDALVREVVEEAGADLLYDTQEIIYALRRRMKCGDYVKIAYLAIYEGGDIVLGEEHSEYQWVRAEEITRGKYNDWVKESVQKAQKQIELNNSLHSWHRCLADFDNYKKRQIEQQKEFTKYAAEGVINDMLPVLDNFHAATAHVPEGDADSPWVTGIMFIQQQMDKVFEEHGVSRIDVNVDDEFDPMIMEAMKDDDEQVQGDAVVKKIVQQGYKIGEKVLRPARVVLK